MFNCLPGAMLSLRHTHEWKKGFSCGRVLLHDTASSHRLFNPAPPEATLSSTTRRSAGLIAASRFRMSSISTSECSAERTARQSCRATPLLRTLRKRTGMMNQQTLHQERRQPQECGLFILFLPSCRREGL